MSTVHQAIVDVMSDVGAIGKNNRNVAQNYNFRSVDDLYNKLSPLFAKNGLFLLPKVLEKEEQQYLNAKGNQQIRVSLKVEYNVTSVDGSSVQCVVCGEGVDSGDKATNKAFTACFKYLMIQLFCIAVEGEVDADSESPQVAAPAAPKPAFTPKPMLPPAKIQKMPLPVAKEPTMIIEDGDDFDAVISGKVPLTPPMPKSNVRADLITAFDKIGIASKRIEKKYNIANWVDLNDTQIEELRGIYKKIKGGLLLKNQAFPLSILTKKG